jgi:hypothetical protein
MCLGVADARHRASENLHVTLLHISVALGDHPTDFDNGSGRRRGGRHQSCAVEFFASLFFKDQFVGIVDFLERSLYCIAEKARVKPGTSERVDAGMNELPEPVGRLGSRINIGLLWELADFREAEALHLLHHLHPRPPPGGAGVPLGARIIQTGRGCCKIQPMHPACRSEPRS